MNSFGSLSSNGSATVPCPSQVEEGRRHETQLNPLSKLILMSCSGTGSEGSGDIWPKPRVDLLMPSLRRLQALGEAAPAIDHAALVHLKVIRLINLRILYKARYHYRDW